MVDVSVRSRRVARLLCTGLIAGGGLAAVSLTGSAVGAAPVAHSAAGKFTARDAKTVHDFVGGKLGTKADPSKSPVTIGWTNQQGGFLNFSAMSMAANTAVDVINNDLGGVDGHPLKLSNCFVVTSDQQGQQCGEQFLNNKKINLVAEGYLSTGVAQFHSALGNTVPILGAIPNPADETKLPDAFYISSGINATAPTQAYVLKLIHAKHVVLVHQNDSVDNQLFEQIERPELEKLGFTVTSALYPPNATSMLAPLISGGAKTADALIAIPTYVPQCISIAQALEQLHVTAPVITSDTCDVPAVAKALGGDLPHWIFGAWYPPIVSDPDKAMSGQVHAYEDAVAQYGKPSQESTTFAPMGFATVLEAYKFLLDGGGSTATRASIGKAIRQYSGPAFLSAPEKWGVKPFPSVGNQTQWYARYLGHGKWADIAPNKWIGSNGTIPATSK